MEKSDKIQPNQEGLYSWTCMKGPNGILRSGHASIIYKNYIVVFGGRHGQALNSFVAFNIESKAWVNVHPAGDIPTAREGLSMCLTKDQNAVIFGGKNLTYQVVDELDIMEIQASEEGLKVQSKAIIKNEKGPKRALHSAHIFKNNMYIFGGIDQDYASNNDLWALDLDTNDWKFCQTLGTIPERSSHASVLHKGKLYVFGGYSKQQRTYLNDLNVLDIQTLKWENITPIGDAPSRRSGMSAQEIGGNIFIFGGYFTGPTYYNEFYAYSTANKIWKKIESNGNLPSVRHYHASVAFKNNLFILAGESLNSNVQDLWYCSVEEEQIKKKEKFIMTKEAGCSLKAFFLDNSFADVTLQVENQEFPAHKVILSARSNFFKNMFLSGMMESKSSRITIPETSAITFKALLAYIYWNEISINEELAYQLLEIGDKYLMSDLKTQIEEFLSEELNSDNFLKIAELSDRYGSDILREAILDFASINCELINEKLPLEDLSSSILIEVKSKVSNK